MSQQPAAQAVPECAHPSRRAFVAGGGVAAVVGAMTLAEAAVSPASAAPATATWKLGGNTGVNTDGTNFLGTKNVAPLVFKTAQTSNTPVERMRIQVNGRVAINSTIATTQLDVASGIAGCIRGTSTNSSASATGVRGVAASGYGVFGESTGAYGVGGSGGYCGVTGDGDSYGAIFSGDVNGTYSSGDTGVVGAGSTNGVYGSGATNGVRAVGGTYGVYGTGTSNGVYGSGPTGVAGYGGGTGVFGGNASSSGVRGDSSYVGMWGTGNTWGCYALSKNTTGQVFGMFGATDSPGGYGVYSDGNMHVNGTLSKAAGSFKIDHPLEPDRKWLSHSFVESPDMMNVYNGNVTTGADGRATVKLPAYFSALNGEFRYQLTVLGDFAQAVVSRKINDGRFEIRTDRPRVEVSWQVTGIRKDPYARAHPIVVETDKTATERGTRQFVPPGSRARKMQVRPTGGAVPQLPAPGPEPVTPRR